MTEWKIRYTENNQRYIFNQSNNMMILWEYPAVDEIVILKELISKIINNRDVFLRFTSYGAYHLGYKDNSYYIGEICYFTDEKTNRYPISRNNLLTIFNKALIMNLKSKELEIQQEIQRYKRQKLSYL